MNKIIYAPLMILLISSQVFAAPKKRSSPVKESISTKQSRAASEHSFGLAVQPLWLLLGGIGADADLRLTPKTSLLLGGMYVPSHEVQGTDTSSPKYKLTSYEIYLGPKYMLTGDYDRNGAYVFAGVGYTGVKISEFGSFRLSGSLDAPEAKVTLGYQFVGRDLFKCVFGIGGRILPSSDIVVRHDDGREALREKSSTLSSLVLDLSIGVMI